MKKNIFLFAGVISILFSCTSSEKKSLDSFFFVEGSRGPVCWLIEKSETGQQKKMMCYDFQNRKMITEISVQSDSGFYFPPKDTLEKGFFIQSGDRIWFLYDSNRLEARNIYTWEILDDNTSFGKKYPELKSGIKQLQHEQYGMKGFDIISNDGQKYYYDMEQLLMQPFEVWEKFVKERNASRIFYSNKAEDSLILFRNLNLSGEGELEGVWLNALSPDTNELHVAGNILAADNRYTIVLKGGKKNGTFILKCYEKNPLKISWQMLLGENEGNGYRNKFGFSNDNEKNKREISFTMQAGKVLIQNYSGTHNAASFNLSHGQLLWTANADSLFKFVEGKAMGNSE